MGRSLPDRARFYAQGVDGIYLLVAQVPLPGTLGLLATGAAPVLVGRVDDVAPQRLVSRVPVERT